MTGPDGDSILSSRHEFVDERQHPCGCVTAFDVVVWRSVARYRCAEHAPLDPSYNASSEET